VKVRSVKLKNFRGYSEEILFRLDDFTALIGKNDAGKSSVLDALDIFFENSKPDAGDASKQGDASDVCISVEFDSYPNELDLDSGALTRLSSEYLLNENNRLEICKKYNLSGSRVAAPKVFARAMHPKVAPASELIQKTNRELKTLVREMGLEAVCNQSENPSMRAAIYHATGPQHLLESVEIPFNDGNGKSVWEGIQKYLPIFALFKSDRASSDQDPEVQNPMKAAIQRALAELEPQLNDITSEVQKRVNEIADRTLEQLRATYPDIANSLSPIFKTPNWQKVFALDLESDEGIPLNKRGSGVRRLVLISFFQAEAVKAKEARLMGQPHSIPIFYAVEEPETSQHPDNQELIVSALHELSKLGDQVLLTTHVPALAGLMPTESLRYLTRNEASGLPEVQEGTPEVYRSIARALGVLTDSLSSRTIKVAVLVEGKTDIDALTNFAHTLMASGDIDTIDLNSVFWTMGGGSTLKDWVARDYLSRLDLPQVVIMDSDRTMPNAPLKQWQTDLVRTIGAHANRKAFVTRKKEIENYLCPARFALETNGTCPLPPDVNTSHCKLPDVLFPLLQDAVQSGRLTLEAVDLDGNRIPIDGKKKKALITSHFMSRMTSEEILNRSAYVEEGVTKHEIVEWLSAIQEFSVA